MARRRIARCHAWMGTDDRFRAEAAARVGAAGRAIAFFDDARALERSLGDVEALLCGLPAPIDWSGARRLRLVQATSSGVEWLLPLRGFPPGAHVANARGMHLPEMRDHAAALILALARDLPRAARQQAAKRWRSWAPGTVAGRTAGILGLGEVGRGVAAACAALGMRVVGTRASAVPTPHVEEVWPPERTDRILAQSDFLVVALPLVPATRGLLGARALATLPPGAAIVVLSRGGIVDESALATALRAGRLRGAALDVFDREPLPRSSPLWSLPGVIVTPHVAGRVADFVARGLALFLENVDLVERGLPPRTAVDPARGW